MAEPSYYTMDPETQSMVRELSEKVRRLKDRVAELEEVNLALTGELIKKNTDPDYLPAA